MGYNNAEAEGSQVYPHGIHKYYDVYSFSGYVNYFIDYQIPVFSAHSSSCSSPPSPSRSSSLPLPPPGRTGTSSSCSDGCPSSPSRTGSTHSSTGSSREASPLDERHNEYLISIR